MVPECFRLVSRLDIVFLQNSRCWLTLALHIRQGYICNAVGSSDVAVLSFSWVFFAKPFSMMCFEYPCCLKIVFKWSFSFVSASLPGNFLCSSVKVPDDPHFYCSRVVRAVSDVCVAGRWLPVDGGAQAPLHHSCWHLHQEKTAGRSSPSLQWTVC